MSDVIRLLPDHIANQIAAGEVIQRPASVIKELVENAIDANASSIEIHVKDAGKTLIQVIDDGCGMSEADSLMAFERHATSKLHHADDLFQLKTKGFRGEALASIAAIAHVTLQTRQADSDWGLSVHIEGSSLIDKQPVTCKKGSSFAVKNLFFNVPARRNFLKSDAVEFTHIEEEFIRIALAHPEKRLVLNHNEQVVHHLEEASLRKRIVDLFGRAYNDRLVPITEATDIVAFEGFIVKPEFSKKSRGEQYFFVNNRFFKDPFFNHAVTQAYENLLASKTYPGYFIFLTVDPAKIDVNVHPTKTEIKFEDDKYIYSLLKSTVRLSLGKFNIAPSLDFEQETSFDLPWEYKNKPVVEPSIQVNPNYNPFSSGNSGKSVGGGISKAIKNLSFGTSEASKQDWEQFYDIQDVQNDLKAEQTTLFQENEVEVNKQFLFHGNYIISSLKDSLLIVHYKNAKERILYDEMMNLFISVPLNSQTLLFPLELEVKSTELALLEEQKLILNRLGFTWSVTGNQVSLSAVPEYLSQEEALACLTSIIAQLVSQTLDNGELAHIFVLEIAQKAAFKNLSWTQETANSFIEQLFASPEHQYSPSGKLILKMLNNNELFSGF